MSEETKPDSWQYVLLAVVVLLGIANGFQFRRYKSLEADHRALQINAEAWVEMIDSDNPSANTAVRVRMTSEKPRRRWFRPRYSLATLFVVVTVFGCWLGYSSPHKGEEFPRTGPH